MRDSFLLLAAFALGVAGGVLLPFPSWLSVSDLTYSILLLLLFLVGVGLGGSADTWRIVVQAQWRVVLVPLLVVVGTLLGTAVVAHFLSGLSAPEGMAVGAGFGYYSLSSIVIGQLHSEELGVVALLANVMREMMTLVFAPWLVRYLGNLAPIASGGATAMDTSLPVIARFAGKEFAVIAVFSGLVLTILVPFLVTFILRAA